MSTVGQTRLGQVRSRVLRPVQALPRPRLTIVPKVASKAPRVPFVVLVVTILVAGLVGLLVLNTTLQRGAYQVGDLRRTSAALDQREQRLEVEVAQLEQPQHLLAEAQRLGMVWTDSPAFLALPTGRIMGDPKPGSRADAVALGTRTPGDRHDKVNEIVAGTHTTLGSGLVTVSEPHRRDSSRDAQR
jgi:cell division protein FtsL